METAKVFLLFPLSLLIKINFASWNTHFWTYFFISCSFSLSYSNIPRYLYPSFSISLIFSLLGNYTISLNLTFSLFIIITPHFSILNSMPLSCLKTSTVDNNSFNSHSLFPYRFKSSANGGFLILSPPLKVYFVLALRSTS